MNQDSRWGAIAVFSTTLWILPNAMIRRDRWESPIEAQIIAQPDRIQVNFNLYPDTLHERRALVTVLKLLSGADGDIEAAWVGYGSSNLGTPESVRLMAQAMCLAAQYAESLDSHYKPGGPAWTPTPLSDRYQSGPTAPVIRASRRAYKAVSRSR